MDVLLEPYEAGDPVENMRRDGELLDRVLAEPGVVLGRTFGWNRICLSRGIRQKIDHLVDLERARAAGIPIVDRPTGGMLALHGNDFCFGLAVSLDEEPWKRLNVDEAAGRVNEWIAAALRDFGFEPVIPAAGSVRSPSPKAPDRLCAANYTASDILLGGRKLLGAALRKRQGVLLYQATLPLRPPPPETLAVLRDEEIRRRIVDGSTALSEHGEAPAPEALAARLEAWKGLLVTGEAG